MKIELTRLGKRYNRDWVFRGLDFQFEGDGKYAITGPNGSGKSTLLQVIAGSAHFNEGNIHYSENGKPLSGQHLYSRLSFAAPYLEMIDEMTLTEFYTFHQRMKGWLPGIQTTDVIVLSELGNAAEKQIRNFSSGMKQRVKLAQAIFSNVPLVLLDEPLTNLDEEGISLYYRLVAGYMDNRLVIVSSNDKKEYAFCRQIIDLREYKQSTPPSARP